MNNVKDKILIEGKWKPIKPISGPWKKKEKIKTVINIKTENLKSSVFEKNIEKEREHSGEINSKASWSVIEVDVSAKYNNIEKNIKSSKIEESIKKEKEFNEEREIEIEIDLDKNDTIYICKLIYENENFYYEADATQIREDKLEEIKNWKVDPMIINITMEKIKLLKDIEVVYTDDMISRPDDIIKEVDGNIEHSDINFKHGGRYVWLKHKYTYIVDEAATDIKIRFEKKGDGNSYDLSKGDGNNIFRYLEIIKDKKNSNKILFDKIKLYRTPDKKSLPTGKNYGYEKYTRDINEGRDGNYETTLWDEAPKTKLGLSNRPITIKKHYYLYLCWDTITF